MVMIPPLGVTAPLVLYHTGSGRLQGDKAKEAPSRGQGRNCLGQSRGRWLGAQRWVLVFECYLPATPLALSGKARVGDTPCWRSLLAAVPCSHDAPSSTVFLSYLPHPLQNLNRETDMSKEECGRPCSPASLGPSTHRVSTGEDSGASQVSAHD